LLGAKNDLEEKKKQVLDLQKSLVDKSREIKKVQAEKQIELDALQAEKEILQLDVDSLQDELKKSEGDLGNKKKELTGVKKKLKEQLQQSKSLELTRFLRKDQKKLQGDEEDLKKNIEKLQKQLTKKEKEVVNVTYNINEINVSQGHAMIGNTMKDDTDLSYKLEKALETNMEIPPK
jgi:chromosome segregation protein